MKTSPARRRRQRGIAVVAFLGLLASASIDALWVEPYWIQVTRHEVQAPVKAPLKIAHLTDLHTNGLDGREKRLLALLEEEKPDVVIITGDTVGSAVTYDRVREVLVRLQAPLGVWLVRGNWENWRPVRNEAEFYRAARVGFLLNQAWPIRDDVWLVGFDDPATGSAQAEAADAVPPGAYAIALFHSPAFFDRIAGRVPLSLAGHSHGGQVRLPLLPPLWLPAGVGAYVEGWYEQSGSRLYVSRGIGTSILDVRFFCRPELSFITLHP
jgi:hypothetical protein